ncbi:MAG: cysteine--tRNA ligase [Sulfurospirillum sp.]|nr:cysteine--tRNA ligase [Sulfurospirillum sp.]
MVIYDSQQRKKVTFEPIKMGEAKIYVCGPTVYDDAHLGHARSALSFDLLRRVLKALDFTVTFVKNFTDIDDKIINKMQQEKKSLEELTSFYIQRYKDEMHTLGIEDADIEPKATQSIDEMRNFIQVLLEKNIAYKTDDGIYFDTTKDPAYLSLSHMQIQKDLTQARVQENLQKRDFKDFALWKFSKADEPSYDAAFGVGRPGWHIECSCMIEKHLKSEGAFQIDIHAGGADLLFPHHENEAAQTRCKSGQELAKYWMHNGFVTINGEKMSKSLGNSFFLKDALFVYDGEILRFYLLSSHYRANFNFSEEDLLVSKKRLDKLYRLKKRVYGIAPSLLDDQFKKPMLEALSDDLNISKALAHIDEMIMRANEFLDAHPKDTEFKSIIRANLAWLEQLLGIGLKDPFAYFQLGVDTAQKNEIEKLIKERSEAKAQKDFARADSLRETLTCKGILLMDTPQGTQWEKSE